MDPLLCTVFLFASFVFAGVLQTLWFKCSYSGLWKVPLDGGRMYRGRRIFGDNKTLSGFVVMVPATALAFWFFSQLLRIGGATVWELSPAGYGLLGSWAGFWFMAGELPNSFMKRQFDIQPGEPAPPGWRRTLCFVMDQVDSVLAALIAIALIVPLPISVCIWVVTLGGVVHWLFNVALMMVGLKTRAA